ncbi:MAG TPA: hypothetical protein VI408_06360 [Gaiellaceae bacterium]
MGTTTAIEEPLAFGVRENRALFPLRDALREALASNRPVHVQTTLSQQELIRLAVRLCRYDNANVGVLAGPGDGVILVPV